MSFDKRAGLPPAWTSLGCARPDFIRLRKASANEIANCPGSPLHSDSAAVSNVYPAHVVNTGETPVPRHSFLYLLICKINPVNAFGVARGTL